MTAAPPGGHLILFPQRLNVRFAVRVEELFTALLPRGLESGCRDVPIWPALAGDGTQVLTQIFQSRTPKEPVTVVDLMDDEAWLENYRGESSDR